MMDDVALWLQALVDRLSRWVRLRAAQGRGRRFLIVQIDGLSRAVLDRALAERRLPALARLLAAGRLARRHLSVGIPSSTPAFQASLMYGVRPDIPGFHWHDKRDGQDRYFPRPGVADLVERRHARGRRGIMEGGSCYGCVFTGGATDSLWTMARLLRPTRAGLALLRAPLSFVLLAWVVLKCSVLTLLELARVGLRLVADPASLSRRGIKWLLFKIGLSVWTRQLFTLAASADLYRGVPAVYVNYLEYDVFAHAFGPEHRLALRALRRVDRSLAQLVRILRRIPEHGYDLYVLSDHGQALTLPFARVSPGTSLEAVVLRALGGRAAPEAAPPTAAGHARPATVRRYRRAGAPGLFQRFLTYLDPDVPDWLEEGGRARRPDLRVVPAGPNAFVYFTDSSQPLTAEEIERRHPGGPATLSRHASVGFVLARSAAGPVCWHRGRRLRLDADDGPFHARADREVVVAGLTELMAMPSAGDLVLYGIGAPSGDVSFLEERGGHAGPSEAELHTFIFHPPSVGLPEAPLHHPIQLYPHFAAYRDGAPAGRSQ